MTFLTTKEFAKEFLAHQNTIRKWLKNGIIKYFFRTPTGRYRINEKEVSRLATTMKDKELKLANFAKKLLRKKK